MYQDSVLRHRYTRQANATMGSRLPLLLQMESPKCSPSSVTGAADTFVVGNQEEFIHLGHTV